MTKADYEKYRTECLGLIKKSGLYLTPEEESALEITDFNLNNFYTIGLALHVYINTERACAKELAMHPGQICPEHRHPPLSASNPGKEETFRCRYGEVYLYVPGTPAQNMKGKIPAGKENSFTVFHEIILHKGEQYTLMPDTLHWFQAGPDGAVVAEFSSYSDDGTDIFTDPEIMRYSKIK